VEQVEHLSELLFELSNQDRLQILLELQEEQMKLTQISKKLDLTAQETSRHLNRMNKASLVEKKSNGAYDLTEFGKQILHLLPGFNFILKNREYFLTHTTSHIPQSFVKRIGQLDGSEYCDNAILLFQMVETLITKANEYIWILSDQALASSLPLLMAALERGVSFRTILPKSLGPPRVPDEMIPDFGEFRQGPMENKHLDTVETVIILSEKEAIFALPTTEMKIDYLGFHTQNRSGHQLCYDLFMHYWENSEPT